MASRDIIQTMMDSAVFSSSILDAVSSPNHDFVIKASKRPQQDQLTVFLSV